ncbi:hypothetical protein BD408DRAFT_422518 [Parasitella parasitica]|nr:hypothetical protein BD408DRAFT_422518 [Parasitella parasitica]
MYSGISVFTQETKDPSLSIAIVFLASSLLSWRWQVITKKTSISEIVVPGKV